MNLKKMILMGWLNSGGDAVAPTVVITTNVLNLAGSTFIATFTFSEAVTGFVAGDVTVANCTVGALSTSDNIVFTSTITNNSAGDSACTLQVPAACCVDAGGNNNTASSVVTIEVEPYMYRLFGSNLAMYIEPAFMTTTLKESNLDGSDPVARTAVIASGDSVGTMYDISNNGMKLFAANNSSRPTILTKVGSDAWLKFNNAISTYMTIPGSREFFNVMTNASPGPFAFAFEFDFSELTDGVSYYLFDSSSNTTVNSGFLVERTTGNKIRLFAGKASPGNNVWNYTSTATLNAAAGKCKIRFQVNGVGGAAGSLFVNDNAAETFNINAGVNSLKHTSNLIIGRLASLTNGHSGSFRKWVVTNHTWSAGEVTAWKAYDPQINTSISIYRKFREIDTDDNTLMFKDAQLLQAVTSNDDDVRVIKLSAPVSNFGDLRRSWISTSFYVDPDKTKTNGSYNITINGTNYLFTLATSGTLDKLPNGTNGTTYWYQSSLNFITTHAANILSQQGLIVYYQPNNPDTYLGRLYFWFDRIGVAAEPTVAVTNVSGDLAGTKSDTKRAKWKTNTINGYPSLAFTWPESTNYEMQDTAAAPVQTEAGGNWTKFFIVKYNQDGLNAGAHYAIGGIISSSVRWLLTGNRYPGNPSFPNGNYHVIHTAGPTFGDAGVAFNQWHLITIKRLGLYVKVWIDGVAVDEDTIAANSSLTIVKRGMGNDGDNVGTNVDSEGRPSRNNWEGGMAPTLEWTGVVPDAVIDSKNAELVLKYDLG